MTRFGHYDAVLVGAGIMSATLATLLHELNPDIRIAIYERLDDIALESSDAWNNAGTGHSAFCELNYTPQASDGSVDISKAVAIAEAFEVSRQFWSYMIQQGYGDPRTWINATPHCSVVFGAKDVQFLQTRYEAMKQNPLFAEMQFSTDIDQIREWMPLVMEGRDSSQPVAATYMSLGTDVNFGELTRTMISHLVKSGKVSLFTHHEVHTVDELRDRQREIEVMDLQTHQTSSVTTGFIFIGAGGGALKLLQKSGITERKGLGGFPVSGQWLVCTNPSIIAQHEAKVYGKAALGAPPMSVPHLDTRIIDGQKALLFGPFAGFTTKYLKTGSWLDLPLSLAWHNLKSMIGTGIHNIPLTRYLIQQVLLKPKDRLEALREYMPTANATDRELKEAGYRVQIIKPDPTQGGVLQFGTEVIVSEDKSLATLLGASPGASTSVDIMLKIIQQCFPQYLEGENIVQMIPGYGKQLHQDPSLLQEVRQSTTSTLKLL